MNQITLTAVHRKPSPSPELMILSRTVRTAALLTILISSQADSSRAQTIPSPYRVIERAQGTSVFWGTMYLTPGSLDLGPKTGSFLGARYSIEASGPLFIDGLVSYLPTTRDIVDPRRALGDRIIGETDVALLMADARLNFSLTGRRTWNRLSPHLFMGGGIAIDVAGQGEFADVLLPEDIYDFGTGFTATAGTGWRIALTSRLMLYAEAGLSLWKLNTPSGFDDPEKRPQTPDMEPEPVVQSEWVRGYGLTLSAGWRF